MAKDTGKAKSSDKSNSQIVTEEKQVSLSAAKDRAQLTATTAMSVVHVALLKSLVEGGPDANRYYAVVIVLIIIALAIQVVIGVLAIFVTHTRNYYQKYHSDMCSEFTGYWCKCFPWRSDTMHKTGVDNPDFDVPPVEMNITNTRECATELNNIGTDVSSVDVVVGNDRFGGALGNSVARSGEILSKVTTATRDDLNAITSEVRELLAVQLFQAKLAAIEAEVESDNLNEQLAKERKRRERYLTDVINERLSHMENAHSDITKETERTDVDTTDVRNNLGKTKHKKNVAESDKRIVEIEAAIERNEAIMRRVESLRRQDDLVAQYVDHTLEGNVLKKVSFWQNVINYLLYTVFVCNAFITGLGVSGGQRDTSGAPGGLGGD